MKFLRITSLILVLVLTLSFLPACSSEFDNTKTYEDDEEYVIKTRTGECYHYEGCWTIENSIGTETITKTEAIEDYGLRACSQCSE